MEFGPPSSPPQLAARPKLVRKRTRASELSESQLSSDPAFFSGDDTQDDGAENYTGQRPRKKAQWCGTWWGDRVRSGDANVSRRTRSATKQNLTRNFDSGIFMGSDNSDTTLPDSDCILPEHPLPAIMPETTRSSQGPQYKKVKTEHEMIEEAIAARVQAAVEIGNGVVDLAAWGLTELPGPLLLPLDTIVSPPIHLEYMASSDGRSEDYQPFTGECQLYLANNHLVRLPNEVLSLLNLTVLSLRGNNLTELPARICELSSLVELNVSNNKLRHLPASILRFSRFEDARKLKLNVSQNPLLQAFPVESDVRCRSLSSVAIFRDVFDIDKDSDLYECLNSDAWPNGTTIQFILGANQGSRPFESQPPEGWQEMIDLIRRYVVPAQPKRFMEAIAVASTPITYLGIDGKPVDGGVAPSEMTTEQVRELICQSLDVSDEPPAAASSVPSLFELGLRGALRASNLAKAAAEVPADTPPSVMQGLEAAIERSTEPPRECTTCDTDYVIARTEWIEFVRILTTPDPVQADQLFLPLLHRGCSWNCREPLAREFWSVASVFEHSKRGEKCPVM